MPDYVIRFGTWIPTSISNGEAVYGFSLLVEPSGSGMEVSYNMLLPLNVKTELLHVLALPGDAEQKFRLALLRHGMEKLERGLRDGSVEFPDNGQQSQHLGDSDILKIHELLFTKKCDFQSGKGRDLYCTATRGDTKRPISKALCLACPIPASEFLCSQLAHPISGIVFGQGGGAVFNGQAMCGLGREEVTCPADCRLGGHQCAVREVDIEPIGHRTGVSPESLPDMLDFVDTTWRLAFGKANGLLRLRSVASVTDLSKRCQTKADFSASVSALGDIIKSMSIPDDLLLPDERIKEENKGDKTLNRLSSLARTKLRDPAALELALNAIRIFRNVNSVRVALQHSARASLLGPALEELGID